MNISQCNFLVDSYFPGDEGSALQPNYVLDKSTWEEISCRRFLDTKRTSLLGRIIWIPDLPFIPEKLQRKWGRYCLLRRRNFDTRPWWLPRKKILRTRINLWPLKRVLPIGWLPHSLRGTVFLYPVRPRLRHATLHFFAKTDMYEVLANNHLDRELAWTA